MAIKTPVDTRLAIEGGTPVRSADNPLPEIFPRDVPQESYDNIREVLEKGLSSGYLPRFEQEFAEVNGSKYCVSLANCTATLHTIIAAMDIGPGKEVIVNPITDLGSVAGIMAQGAIPIFPDVDISTGNVTAETIEKVISERTAAIIAVHWYGLLCPMDDIVALAKKHNILLIEDVCQAPLAKYKGRNAGTLGDVGAFSFDAEKHLSGGHGGALLTDNKDIADRVHLFGVARGGVPVERYGRKHVRFGLNMRFGELEAAFVLGMLHILEEQNQRRRETTAALSQRIDEDIPGLIPPYIPEGADHIYWYYYLRVDPGAFTCGLWDLSDALMAEGLKAEPGPWQLVPDSHTFLHTKTTVAGESQWPWDHPMNEFAKDIEYSADMVPIAKEHVDTTIRWNWTDKYTDQDVEDMATILAKVTNRYRA